MDLGATGREGERTNLDLDRTTGMESHGGGDGVRDGGDGVRDGEDGSRRSPSPHHAPRPTRRQGVAARP